jgi:hypothetical protein
MSKGLGAWKHSKIFAEIHTAKEWHMSPSQFSALSDNDKALMIAYDRAFGDMQAYENYLQIKETEKLV